MKRVHIILCIYIIIRVVTTVSHHSKNLRNTLFHNTFFSNLIQGPYFY